MSRAESKGVDGKILFCHFCLIFLCLYPTVNCRVNRELMFGSLLTPRELKSVASGYFLQDGILVRKLMPHGEEFVGDPNFQVVVPFKCCGLVLKLAHDGSGHLGVRKTYDRILRHFF